MSVSFELSDFFRAANDLEAGLANAAHEAVKGAVKAAFDSARTTPLFNDITGALRSSVTSGISAPCEGFIRAGAKHARWVESGTPPHIIQGRNGGALRFVVAGSVIFRRSVQHPGTAERPFMARAAALGEQTLDYGLEYLSERPIANFNQG